MSLVSSSPRTVGRYLMGGPIAVGGMASVHLGRIEGSAGFKKPVAIKRMLASSADTEARAMLLDEARLASRVQHANVVQTLDVIEDGPELFVVLEYVHGESFDQLQARARSLGQQCPARVAAGVVAGALRGLHAAHEAKGEDGQPLDLVHRDFSPHNVLVGIDGVPRVLDFGVARARGRLQGTRDGQLKGKLAYLSPEQVHGEASRRSDVFAAGIVLWEALTGQRLFDAPSEAEVLSKVLLCRVPPLDDALAAWQPVLDRALERDPEARFPTALAMAEALERAVVATTAEISAWVSSFAQEVLAQRGASLEALERAPATPAVVTPPAVPLSRTRSTPLAALIALGVVVAGLGAVAMRAVLELPEPQPTPQAVVPPLEATPAPVPPTPAPEPPPPPSPVVAKPKPTRRDDASKSAPDRCNPPFTIDANGVKQFKVECLK
ncbi:MAG: serine/threonine protein kinase [Myxococcaceae bacterium]|nr:serine/threonine protein kinase [Myxococcaceae bacterium]